MKALCLVLGVILAAMAGATAYFQPMHASLGLAPSRAGASFSRLLSDLEDGGTLSALTGGGLVNILLIGSDRREGESGARSDSIILCSFDRRGKKLILTSFLRDLYVPIPGNGSNRLNAAYAFGGSPLLKKTLEDNFQVEIDGTVEVNFDQFSQIVDTLGGVTLELRPDEVEQVNLETGSALSPGTLTLNGQQALAYSRIRKLDADGDFSRTARQRKVISALLDACRQASLREMVATVSAVLPMVDTDLNSVEILKYTAQLLPMLSGATVVSQYVPAAGSCRDETIDGMSVLVADAEEIRRQLRESLS